MAKSRAKISPSAREEIEAGRAQAAPKRMRERRGKDEGRGAARRRPKRAPANSAQGQMGLHLRRRQGRGHGRHAQSARRQGRQPRRDGQSRPAGAARLHHHHRGLHLFLRQRQNLSEGSEAAGRGGARPQSASITGKTFGDGENPLLVSVRSGARASMPGMMDTVLNLGLNDETVEALAKKSGDRRFAYDSYRRFITMYSDVVLGIDAPSLRGNPRRAQGPQRLHARHRSRRRRLGRAGRALQGARRGGAAASRSRRTRTRSCGARSARCSARG